MVYTKIGHGEKQLIMLSGIGLKSVLDSASAVESAYSIFIRDYTIWLFDRDEKLCDNYTVEDMARETAAILTGSGVRNAYIFGASQGGMIGMILGIKYPHLVSRLALVSCMCRSDENINRIFDNWIGYCESGNRIALNRSFAELVYSPSLCTAMADYLSEHENDGTDEELRRFAILSTACRNFNCSADLHKIKDNHIPTLILCGGCDRIFCPDAAKEISDRTDGKLIVRDGFYHAVYDEDLEFKTILKEFFEDRL